MTHWNYWFSYYAIYYVTDGISRLLYPFVIHYDPVTMQISNIAIWASYYLHQCRLCLHMGLTPTIHLIETIFQIAWSIYIVTSKEDRRKCEQKSRCVVRSSVSRACCCCSCRCCCRFSVATTMSSQEPTINCATMTIWSNLRKTFWKDAREKRVWHLCNSFM